jgi:hypothetical protein
MGRATSRWYKAFENEFYELQGRGSSGNKEYRILCKSSRNFIVEARSKDYTFCVAICDYMAKSIKNQVDVIILGGESGND